MAEVTNPPPGRRVIPLVDLPGELLLDMLLRLPPKSVIRCRAVCKAWRRITTDRAFLLAHHGRQPSQRLLSFVRDVGPNGGCGIIDLNLLDYCIEAVDFRTREFRSVVRFTGNDYSRFDEDDCPFTVHAACDGLLLMSYYDSLYICNPATREWASVRPPSLRTHKIAGLYVHSPSGEYRVLSYREVRQTRTNEFFINTVGSKNMRRIKFGSYSESMRNLLAGGSKATKFFMPFLSNGKLHWLPQSTPPKNILVFDTMAEEFSWLPTPVETWHVVLLLEVEGTLAMSESRVGTSKVDLWVLQDYKSAVWVHKYQIELPAAEIYLIAKHERWTSQVVSADGDVLVDCTDWCTTGWQLHYDRKGNLLRKFQCNPSLSLTTHILKESLLPHPFFRMQQDGSARGPPFFRGL